MTSNTIIDTTLRLISIGCLAVFLFMWGQDGPTIESLHLLVIGLGTIPRD